MIKCAVIDDEPLARECIVNYITKIDFLEVVAIANNPVELMSVVDKGTIDLLFLDIHMPLMSGIDYLKATSNRPMIILTTAFPKYALESFELDVIDYLLKPITFNRFFKAVSKAHEYYSLKENTTVEPGEDNTEDYFFVKCNQVFEKIFFQDVQYVEAQENYVLIHTRDHKYMVLMPIKRIEELLGVGFLRVHKSWIVALDKITSIDRDRLSVDGRVIPISRNYRSQVVESVVGEKLWKK